MAPEKRLADVNALLEEVNRTIKIMEKQSNRISVRNVIMCIKNAPTVDAVEVVHARWENISGFDFGNCYGCCSNCKTPQKANSVTALYLDYRYCRWCGAKMDGGNEDG